MALTITAAYLSEIIRAVRVKETTTSKEEVTLLINAAAADLQRRGVGIIDLDDPLTKQAVKLYCKGHYGYDKDNERFIHAYESLADGMALSGDYDEDGDSDG